jgi:MarR family transcriptional regulator, 2-MHQ and catechol-resistance regulon repressor
MFKRGRGRVPSESEKSSLGGYKADLEIDEKVMVALVKASELYKKEADAIFKNYGLTFSQYNVMRVLYNSTDGQNSVTNASKIMLVSSPNMTGIAKRLEKSGFIIRKNDCKDERITLLEITPKGRRILENIRSAHDENMRNYLRSFSGEEKKKLLEDLKRVFNKSPQR